MHCLGRTRALKGLICAQCNRRESESATDDMLLSTQKRNRDFEEMQQGKEKETRRQPDSLWSREAGRS